MAKVLQMFKANNNWWIEAIDAVENGFLENAMALLEEHKQETVTLDQTDN
jgi:hypothetical protein